MTEPEDEFRPVNPLLGTQPKWGPFPAEQLVPWMMIGLGLFILCHSILQLPTFWTTLLIFWGCAVWWMLTGSKPWRFLSQFIRTPNWVRGRVEYHSIFSTTEPVKSRRKRERSPHPHCHHSGSKS